MIEKRNGRRTKVAERPASARRAGFRELRGRGRAAVHLLILAAVSLALYADALRDGFVTDDAGQLVGNPLIKNYHNIPKLFSINVWSYLHPIANNYYRPLQMVFYMGEYYLFGLHAWQFHLGNLLLNVAAVFAAYFLVRALADERLALWAALLFAFQPVHVEAVVWIAAVPELLCALCYFTAMLFYHRARAGAQPARDHGIATAIFFCGLFCKETMLVFPAVLLAYEFFYRRESLRAIGLGFQRLLPYLCALGIYVAIRLKVLGSFAPTAAVRFTGRQTFFTAPVLLCRYIFRLLWPANLSYHYDLYPQNAPDWKFAASAVLIGALAYAMFRMRKSQPLLVFALAWFFVIIAPALSISHVSTNLLAERYLYIPSLGFCILAGWAWLRIRDRVSQKTALTFAYPALALLLTIYSVQIVRRIPDWSSDISLYQKSVQQCPDSPDVLKGLGFSYYTAGQFDLALATFERLAVLEPASLNVHLYLAVTQSALGDSQEAAAELLQADKLRTTEDDPWAIYGQTYANLKQWDRAIEYDRKEIGINPWNPAFYTVLGEALQEDGQTQDSIAAFREAIRLDPGHLDASINLAVTLAQQGDLDQAINLLVTALHYHTDGPHVDAAWLNLGDVYANKGEWNEAADAYQHALNLNPDMAIARDRLDSVEAHEAASRQ